MTAFETIRERTFRYGEKSYLEVARRRLRDDGTTIEFVCVTRGFLAEDGTKRWTRYVTLPDDRELLTHVAHELLREAVGGSEVVVAEEG